MAETGNHEWLHSTVSVSGLLVSKPVLRGHFEDGAPPISSHLRRRIATEWERFQLRPSEGQARWLNVVLEDLVGIAPEHWRKQPEIPERTTHALTEYAQTLRPSRVLVDDEGEPLLLVWIAKADQDLDTRETKASKWRASPTTKLERLLREVEAPLGLVTNGREFRLMYAAEGTTPHITWNGVAWMDDPDTLDAFAMLLGAERFLGDEDERLLALVQESQERQADVTDQLGEQVCAALDQLVRAIGRADQRVGGEIVGNMSFEDIYEMSLVFMMRLVFLLYGEENDLLPHGEVLYDNSYGITHLWTELNEQRHRDETSLPRTHDAFPRLLATFRLIHQGCSHPDLTLRDYGGKLFDSQRFPALENRRLRIPNSTMHSILQQLIFARARMGRGYETQRLSYRELDVEQLGSVYEGLIDQVVKRADEVMVTIDSGDQPVVALTELGAREGDDLADYLRSASGMSAKKSKSVAEGIGEDHEGLFAGLAEKAPHLDGETLQRVAPYADFLQVEGTVLPDDLYVVQQSGARKAGGQYYTPKWITSFICERTLEPLVYEGEDEDRRIKSPEEILNLNVCDPAMGSGAFLVQACRYLSERLVDSWEKIEAANGTHRGITLPFGKPATGDASEVLLPKDRAEALMWARRYVADNCLYGVDINRLAVELAKMSLWLVTLSKDRPFTFLDHKLKQGNSIIGAWAEDIDRYPAKAWSRKADDKGLKEALTEIKKTVRSQVKSAEQEGKGQVTFAAQVPQVRSETARIMREIERLDTMDPGEKERRYHEELEQNDEWQAVRRMYDAWCALWFWPVSSFEDGQIKTVPSSDLPMVWAYREMLEMLQVEDQAPLLTATTEEQLVRWRGIVERLQDEIHFFHWELEFPDVFELRGGFDAIVMNPPWERIKLQENEFFAGRAPEIAQAPNAAARKRLIAKLPETDPALHVAFENEKAVADNSGGFLRDSGHFPLTAVGDINLYPLFAGLGRRLINPHGGVGAVIPSGIATDYYTQDFFRDLMETRSLAALYDFENREGIFHGVHRSYKFSLFFAVGPERDSVETDFAFFLTRLEHMRDEWRHFTLSEEEIALVNPNTRTAPIFRSQRDAQLTKAVYRRHPVLVREAHDEDGDQVGEENPWGIRFTTMFHMANDSGLFHTREELEAEGFELRQPGNHFVRGDEIYLPLYEGKMFQIYDHRAASVIRNEANLSRPAQPMPSTPQQWADPLYSPMPEYWVAASSADARRPESWQRQWFFAFHDVTSPTNHRTFVGNVIPLAAVGHKAPLIFIDTSIPQLCATFIAELSSYAFDYISRQKVGGGMAYFNVKQLPVLSPSRYEEDFCGERLAEIIAPRVLELTYTAWDIRAFAEDMGYHGPPYVWDEQRRAQLRAQLDAIYFHLYGIERDDVDYIMETFPIVKRKDEAQFEEYRTKRLILGYYDAYASGDPAALHTWLGPDASREPQVHSADTTPEGM